MEVKKLTINSNTPKMILGDFTINMLSVLTGQNGTGKTFVMVMLYCLSVMMTLISRMNGDLSLLNYILENCYDDSNINGEYGMECVINVNGKEEPCSLTIIVENRKVIDIKMSNPKVFEAAAPIQFLSKNTRLFSDMDRYLQIKKQVGEEAMTKIYKMYDITRIESLIRKCPYKLNHKMLDEYNNTMISSLDEVYVTDEYFMGKKKDGTVVRMSTLSSGEQSLINMSML